MATPAEIYKSVEDRIEYEKKCGCTCVELKTEPVICAEGHVHFVIATHEEDCDLLRRIKKQSERIAAARYN